jgi:hypothetical protein
MIEKKVVIMDIKAVLEHFKVLINLMFSKYLQLHAPDV